MDVGIPVYNRAQTVRDMRIIVVNDSSTDLRGALVADLAQDDNRILQIDQQCRRSCSPNRFDKQLDYLRRHSTAWAYPAQSDTSMPAAARDLDKAEAERLAVATCAKLIELVNYRPYKLEAEDYRSIRRTLTRVMSHMDVDSGLWCRLILSKTATFLFGGDALPLAARLSSVRDNAEGLSQILPVEFLSCSRPESVSGRCRIT